MSILQEGFVIGNYRIQRLIKENEYNICQLLNCDRILNYLADLQARSETFIKSKFITL